MSSSHFIEDLKKQWMAMVDAIGDPLVIIDRDYHIVRVNIAYFQHAQNKNQTTISELSSKHCYEVFANRKTPCEHCLVHKTLKSGTSQHWETGSLMPQRQYEVRVHPLVDDTAGLVSHAVVHYRDITERVVLFEKLAQSDKLAALGTLSAGVAHELNSPLAGILAFAQMALREMAENDPHRGDMKEIEDAARKCKVIVEGMLSLGRKPIPAKIDKVDLKECIEKTIRLTASLLKKNQVHCEFLWPDNAPSEVRGDHVRLSQVFLNLITNAAHALKDEGGSLTILVRFEARHVEIVFEDDGPGIPAEIQSQIFEPFFTTKEVGEGTGLGLSISHSLVQQHGGELLLSSDSGQGTSFIVRLPL